MLDIRAVVLDLDRTLLRNDRTISAFTQSALARCRANGMKIIIATARPPRAIAGYEAMIQPDAVATMNGASLRVGGMERRSVSMEAEVARRLISQIEHLMPGRDWSLEMESGLYACFDTTALWGSPAAPIVTMETLPHERAYKVLIGLQGPDDADILRSILPEKTYLEVAEGTLGMILREDATKLNGVLMALDELGVASEKAVAFGDDLADIDMLKACGVGVAVANALDEVKAVADDIAPSNEEDGVARWLQKHVKL